jgi:hypothetical protein
MSQIEQKLKNHNLNYLFENTVNKDNEYMICDNSKCDFDTKFNTDFDYKFKVLLKKPEIIFD